MIRSSSSTIMVKNYYIILIHAVYDIPGKSSDGMECLMPLDEIYDHILCSICPVNLPKPDCATTQKPTTSKTVSVTGS